MKRFLRSLSLLSALVILGLPHGIALASLTVTTNQKLATRTGPGTQYDEPGTFLYAGASVTAVARAWDSYNEIWWVQVDFAEGSSRYRVYTGLKRLNVNIQNLLTITKYDGYDPEVGTSTQSSFVAGLDNGRYPSPTTYSFVINVTF